MGVELTVGAGGAPVQDRSVAAIYAPVMALEIRQLRYVVEVADQQNFSRAAERLGIAQPALSQQVLRVERELGYDLFLRHPRGALVTPAGKAFVDDARAAVAAFDDTMERAGRRGRGETGQLTVGFTAAAAVELMPLVLGAFSERYPDVDLRLTESTYADPSGGLASKSTDVAFVVPPLETAGLWFEVLSEEPRVVAVPESHRLAQREAVSVDEILDEPVVGNPGAGEEWDRFWLLAEFRDGRPPSIAAQAETYEAELQIVASGRAVSVTCGASAEYYARPGIAFVPITDIPPAQSVLAYHAGEPEPLVQNFVRLAAEVRDRRRADAG
jgi:DNA-binding transcriptional LysR family regulator